MPSINENATIPDFEEFIRKVYLLPNDRNFDSADMLCNIQRFAMRGIKGIRKQDTEKAKKNLIISLSWFTSTLIRLHIDLNTAVWNRFPYCCSYCGTKPCSCKKNRVEKRQKIEIDESKKPKTIREFQEMFNEIYPANSRTLEHAGIHLAEETGELAEALLSYRGERLEEDFQRVVDEAADYFSCVVAAFSSMELDLAKELATYFSNNCHVCHKAPCECNYSFIKSYK